MSSRERSRSRSRSPRAGESDRHYFRNSPSNGHSTANGNKGQEASSSPKHSSQAESGAGSPKTGSPKAKRQKFQPPPPTGPRPTRAESASTQPTGLPPKSASKFSTRSFGSAFGAGSSDSLGINQGLYSSALHSNVKSGLEIIEQSRMSRLLERYSTSKFHIEYPAPFEQSSAKSQNLSNHLVHGAVSLYRIGACEQLVENFCKWYSNKKLICAWPSISISNHDELQSLYGQSDNYGGVRDFFENASRRKTFRKVFLTILHMQEGFLTPSCALHPLIHTGWALMGDIEDSTKTFLFCEGMAYMYCFGYDHSAMFKHKWPETSLGPFEPSKSRFESVKLDKDKPLVTEIFIDLMDQLHQENNTKKLIEELHKVADVAPFNQKYGRYVRRLLACMFHPEFRLRLDTQSLYAIMALPFDKGATAVGRQVVLCAMCLYTMTEQRNEFFLLHGVTCAYSVLKILEMVGDTQPDVISKIASECITILFGTYLAIDDGAPPFIDGAAHGILLPTAQNDMKCLKRLPHWLLEANKQALAGKDGNPDEFFDEHVYKLLDISGEIWRWPEVQHNNQYRAMVHQMTKDIFVANHAIKVSNTSSV